MKAIIPAAGYATRLWPLTVDTPKHLLHVRGRPIIEHVIQKICELDVREIVIVTNGKFFPVFKQWLESFSCKVPLKLVNDNTISNDERLGQIGDIQLVIDRLRIDEDLLVVAGDNLFNFSLKPVNERFLEKGLVTNALYDIKSVEFAKHLGTVVVDKDIFFTEFYEKAQEPKSTLVSLGIYFFPNAKLGLLKQYLAQKYNPDKMGYFLTWLIQREKVIGHVYTEKWFDIGWKESLDEARKEFEG